MSASPAPPRDDRVLPYTRGLSLFIIPFLVAGFVILYLLPGRSGSLWAWPIGPQLTEMVLASAYLGGAYFFTQVTRRSTPWHVCAPGMLSVALFATLLGVATLLHWAAFSHDNPAFWVWTGLYLAAPFLVLGGWFFNRRHAAPPSPDDERVEPAVRWIWSTVGVLALIQAAVMFVWPGLVLDSWPWHVTELSCRTLAAVWSLGGAGLGLLSDPRRSTFRLMIDVEMVMLALMLVALVVARGDIDTSAALAWPLFAAFALLLVVSVSLWAREHLVRSPSRMAHRS